MKKLLADYLNKKMLASIVIQSNSIEPNDFK
jgi:hypothetical protein